MPIYKLDKNQLLPIKEQKIDLEKNLQKITEDNLETIFGLKFVSSEFDKFNNKFRMDTLAFNEETKSFVIIEFKRDRSFSVVDQGFAYLSQMLNNKAEFILEYNEKMKDDLNRDDVDWSQSKVIFIANSFTNYQQNAINFRDLPIELWEAKKYDNQTILYNPIKPIDSTESIKTISKNKTIEKVSREIVKHDLNFHREKGTEQSIELFDELRNKLFALDNRIEENPNPTDYVGYKIDNSNICSVHIYKSKLKVDLLRAEKKDLNDPENKVYDIDWKRYNWSKLCGIEINEMQDVDYTIFLIKQIFNKFFK